MEQETARIEVDGKTIICRRGDLTESAADAIVNAANNELWMGAGVAGAIKRKGGQIIEEEAVSQGPIPIGNTVVTSGGKLKARHVIHAAVMGRDLTTSVQFIREATHNSLVKAEELRLQSIDFPALGTGVGGFPLDECARIMLTETHKFLSTSSCVVNVGFILYDDSAYRAFVTVLRTFARRNSQDLT